MKTLKRNEIPKNQTWNLDDLFSSRDELKAFLPTLEEQANKITINEILAMLKEKLRQYYEKKSP